MIALGIILLILGYVLHAQALWAIGVILLVIGAVLLKLEECWPPGGRQAPLVLIADWS